MSYNPRAQSKGSAWGSVRGSVRGFVLGSVWGSIRPAGLEGPQDFYLSYFGRLIQSVWNCPGNQDVCKRGIGWKGIGLRRGRLLQGGMVLERLFGMLLCPSLAERHLHCWMEQMLQVDSHGCHLCPLSQNCSPLSISLGSALLTNEKILMRHTMVVLIIGISGGEDQISWGKL